MDNGEHSFRFKPASPEQIASVQSYGVSPVAQASKAAAMIKQVQEASPTYKDANGMLVTKQHFDKYVEPKRSAFPNTPEGEKDFYDAFFDAVKGKRIKNFMGHCMVPVTLSHNTIGDKNGSFWTIGLGLDLGSWQWAEEESQDGAVLADSTVDYSKYLPEGWTFPESPNTSNSASPPPECSCPNLFLFDHKPGCGYHKK